MDPPGGSLNAVAALEVVHGATGVLVVGRGVAVADPSARRLLRIGPVGPVPLPAGPPVVARHDDGSPWRQHWLGHDGLVVEFVDVGRVAVSPDGVVTVDRVLDPELEEHLLLDHVLPLVLAGDGHLVLHGGIISLDGRGVALVGASGAGKSTLAGHAWRAGWTLGNDDGVVLSAGDGLPSAEPTYATLRLTPSGAELLAVEPAHTRPIAGKLRIDARAGSPFRQDPVPLAVVAMVVPAPNGAPARFDLLRGFDAHAELFGSTFHADFSRDDRLPAVLTGLAAVVEAAHVGRLHVPRGRPGLAAAEAVLRSLLDDRGPG